MIPALLAIVLSTPLPASACSCVVDGSAPCEGFWQADAVFVGRVTAISTTTVEEQFGRIRQRQVGLDVSEGFSGIAPGHITIRTGMGGGDCGYPFKTGGTYVVYAHRLPSGQLSTGICSRTAPIEKAPADLAYGRDLLAGRPVRGGVSGTVTLWQPGSPGRRTVPGISLRLSGDGAPLESITDERGRYAFDVGAGEYSLTVDAPPAYWSPLDKQKVVLRDARACAVIDAGVQFDGHVSGRVLDPQARPIPGLTLELAPPRAERTGFPLVRAVTDRDGRYIFEHVPEGRFILGVNVRVPAVAPGLRLPAAYYPGETEPARAEVIALRGGERVALDDLTIPSSIRFAVLRGAVVDADGAPVGGARVYLKSGDAGNVLLPEGVVTEVDGSFAVAAIAGMRFRLLAETSGSAGAVTKTQLAESDSFVAAPGLPPFVLTLRTVY